MDRRVPGDGGRAVGPVLRQGHAMHQRGGQQHVLQLQQVYRSPTGEHGQLAQRGRQQHEGGLPRPAAAHGCGGARVDVDAGVVVRRHGHVPAAAGRAIVIEGKHAKALALGDALGDRNLQTVLQRLDEELWAAKTDKKRSVIGLVAGLVSKTRAMLMARSLLDAGLLKPGRAFPQFKPQIDLLPVDLFPGDRRISPLGLHPYVLFNATRQAANYTRTELVRAL